MMAITCSCLINLNVFEEQYSGVYISRISCLINKDAVVFFANLFSIFSFKGKQS